MVGKVLWYYLGASSLGWGWVRRRVETPTAQARLDRWRARTHDRPVLAGALVLASAFSGFPPFAILAGGARQLRVSLTPFFTLGLLRPWAPVATRLRRGGPAPGGRGWGP